MVPYSLSTMLSYNWRINVWALSFVYDRFLKFFFHPLPGCGYKGDNPLLEQSLGGEILCLGSNVERKKTCKDITNSLMAVVRRRRGPRDIIVRMTVTKLWRHFKNLHLNILYNFKTKADLCFYLVCKDGYCKFSRLSVE